MTQAEAEAIYDLGKEAVVELLLQMDTRIRRLEERLGMDSTNSSKPPSTDNKLTKSPPQKSTDKRTKRGGQKGHKGSTLLQSDTPDFTEVIKPTACSKCQSSLKEVNSPETLRFLHDFTVPFTNNQAQRDLRMIKVKEKISGTIASKRGGEYFARIRGYISTVKKQGAKILEELFNALDGKPFLPQLARGC